MDARQNTTPRGALTPGLAALLDQTCERLAAPAPAPAADPLQLPLFDYNDAGDAVAWNGETL